MNDSCWDFSSDSADFTGAFSSRAGSSSIRLSSPLATESLTGREAQILKLVRDGDSNKQIARKIFVSEDTVKFHLKNLYRKLGARCRTQAVCAAHGIGMFQRV